MKPWQKRLRALVERAGGRRGERPDGAPEEQAGRPDPGGGGFTPTLWPRPTETPPEAGETGADEGRPEPPEEGAEAEAAADPEPPAQADDLWFRASTRVKAFGYWLREKGEAGAAAARAGSRHAAERWARTSHEDRIKAGAVAGVLLLYLVIKFVPVPGVPCGVSAVKECAPGDDAIAFAPAESLLYAHVTLEEDTAQFERAEDAFEELGELERLVVGTAAAAVPSPSGAPVDLRADVLAWAEEDLAVVSIPGRRGSSFTAFIAGVSDRDAAEEFLAKVAPPGEPRESEQRGSALLAYGEGFAAAFSGEELVFGDEAAVRRALDAEAGRIDSLEGSDAGAPMDDLADARFAEAFLSRAGVRRFLAGRPGPASQLDTFVDYGATAGFAAAAIAREHGIEVQLVSELDPELAQGRSPSFFSALPDFEPELAGEIGEQAIGYVGVGEVGPTLAGLLAREGEGAAGLAGSLQALAARLEREANVNPLRDLLPALGGQAALLAEATDGIPFASLIVEDVDEDAATEAMARLQQPLIQSVGITGQRVPRFEETEVEGVKVTSVELSPSLNLSYAVFDGMLVLSTSPAGIERVRDDGGSLAGTESYERATGELPNEVSALVFLNLDELLAQVTRTGLVEDPSFADLTVLFENAASLGLGVQGEEESIRSELFLNVD